MPIYSKKYECLSANALKKLQDERLIKTVKNMYDNVPLFKQRMDELKLTPSDIKGTQDITKLPFSYKSDLRDNYPFGLFAKPLSDVVRVHASSGTTGKQIVVGYTKNDLKMWSKCVARALSAAGATKEDIIQISYGYGLFTGGLGVHDGATFLGATVVPTSTGNSKRQMDSLMDFGSTMLCSTPSYAMYLSEEISKNNNKDKIKLKSVVLGAEPWGENMRRQIEEGLSVKAFDIYGLSEIMGPGVCFECECQNGLHINEDNFLVEILDPKTSKPLKDGEVGELVISTLNKEAFPLIRYKTHDLCKIMPGKCSCGRTTRRISRISGRTDDMLIIRGVNVFPSQIEEVLLSDNHVTPNYQIVVDRVNNSDTLEIKVEMNEEFFFDDVKSIEIVTSSIKEKIRSVLGLQAKITLVGPKSIERYEGKARRVIDNRVINEEVFYEVTTSICFCRKCTRKSLWNH